MKITDKKRGATLSDDPPLDWRRLVLVVAILLEEEVDLAPELQGYEGCLGLRRMPFHRQDDSLQIVMVGLHMDVGDLLGVHRPIGLGACFGPSCQLRHEYALLHFGKELPTPHNGKQMQFRPRSHQRINYIRKVKCDLQLPVFAEETEFSTEIIVPLTPLSVQIISC